jgi:hypothetical protein
MLPELFNILSLKKSLKIPKGQSESVYRGRTENTMAKRKSTKGQTTIYKKYIIMRAYLMKVIPERRCAH